MQRLRHSVLALSLAVVVSSMSSAAAQQPDPAQQQQPTPPAPQPAAPPSYSSGSTSPSASPSGHTVQLDSSAVIGSTVRNAEGQDIGTVSRLMIDPREGRVTSVVVGTGGTLGMGKKEMSIPWSAVKIGKDKDNIVLTVEQQLLEPAPSAETRKDRERKDGGAASPSSGQDPQQKKQ